MVSQEPHRKSLAKAEANPGEASSEYSVSFQGQEYGGDDEYCGPAVAQMILESIGSGSCDQKELFDFIECQRKDDSEIHWHSDPAGIVSVLNEYKPGTFSEPFDYQLLDSEPEASRTVCGIIERGVAPIVLLSGGRHWVVVVGYEASRAPTDPTDDGCEIIQFEVFNPAEGIQCIAYTREIRELLEKSKALCNPAVMEPESRAWVNSFIAMKADPWQGKLIVIYHPNPPDPNS